MAIGALSAIRFGWKYADLLTKTVDALGGHKKARITRVLSPDETEAVLKSLQARQHTRQSRSEPRARPSVPVPLDAEDLAELDSMFGSAGDDPADY